jgi:hypothetical protein
MLFWTSPFQIITTKWRATLGIAAWVGRERFAPIVLIVWSHLFSHLVVSICPPRRPGDNPKRLLDRLEHFGLVCFDRLEKVFILQCIVRCDFETNLIVRPLRDVTRVNVTLND